ncbi:hypothetical protein CY0110_18567 [Crocosphaera chwakensis CCY0110]|uniref:Uncharacterized protein n=1 Tax=Crocosphaera chwakensis CCY0110 TaxID=391612 RepID=A3IJ45_9CHRO|nr:hypothetical protein CY0110_18567 [Crocosphaera chwakensis CCY0110]
MGCSGITQSIYGKLVLRSNHFI